MRRSFPDSGVLIDAARAKAPFDQIAFDYLENTSRSLLTSPFVRLEVVPKASYMQREDELAFYEDFFTDPQVEWCRDWERLELLAHEEARRYGLGALDALHVAAAHLLQADELVTTERPDKPMYRTTLVQVKYLYDGL